MHELVRCRLALYFDDFAVSSQFSSIYLISRGSRIELREFIIRCVFLVAEGDIPPSDAPNLFEFAFLDDVGSSKCESNRFSNFGFNSGCVVYFLLIKLTKRILFSSWFKSVQVCDVLDVQVENHVLDVLRPSMSHSDSVISESILVEDIVLE